MAQRYYPGREMLEGVSLEIFSQEALRAIDHASMEVMSNPGIQVSVPEARALFKEAGCEVDERTKVVRIPEYVVRRALMTAPSKFTLWGREKKYNLEQEHMGKVHWTCFGTGIKMCNYLGPGQYQTVDSTSKDVAATAKLVDWAEHIDYYSLAVSARDWAGRGKEDVHEMMISMENTAKHFHHIDPVGENVEHYFELAKALYGGDEEEARKKPVFSMLLCPTSPLELSSNACQVIVKGARLGIPVNVLSMAMSGGSAPVFLAGTLVTHNAEVLAGITLSQLASPGAKVWYGSSTTAFDLKRGTAPVGSPELGLISAAVAKMGQYYGLPTYVAGI
jgi:trimethylamine--corrinoid protein Co-methyltransferase